MDSGKLAEHVQEWVQEGIITETQAEEILDRYEESESKRSRAIVALSLVGSALVFLGITSFLAANWSELPRLARLAILISGPGMAYAGGIGAYARNLPKIGHALCVLGSLLVGPSLFFFEDLLGSGVADTWLLLAWTTVALSTGHALDSPVGTGLGLLVLVALVVELVEPTDPLSILGLFGVVLFGVGHTRTGRVPGTYRLVGVAVTLGALLLLTTVEGRFSRFGLDLTPSFLAGLIGVLAVMGWLYQTEKRTECGWSGVVLVAFAVSVVIATGAPEVVPAFVGFVVVHLASLVAILATGYLGYRTRTPRLIDLAALAGLLQTISFLASTIADELSGSVALVVAGLLLLAAGLALERGRRVVHSRL